MGKESGEEDNKGRGEKESRLINRIFEFVKTVVRRSVGFRRKYIYIRTRSETIIAEPFSEVTLECRLKYTGKRH